MRDDLYGRPDVQQRAVLWGGANELRRHVREHANRQRELWRLRGDGGHVVRQRNAGLQRWFVLGVWGGDAAVLSGGGVSPRWDLRWRDLPDDMRRERAGVLHRQHLRSEPHVQHRRHACGAVRVRRCGSAVLQRNDLYERHVFDGHVPFVIPFAIACLSDDRMQ